MQSTITEQGQTVIPVKFDPIDALRGRGCGGSADRLIDDRSVDAAFGLVVKRQ